MFSAKTVPITSTRSKTGDLRTEPSSTSGIARDTGPLGEHTEPGGAEDDNEINIDGARPDAEAPGLTQVNLKRVEDKEPVAPASASVVSSLCLSVTTRIPRFEEMAKVANVKVKACRRAARKGKGKDVVLGLMLGAEWGDNTFRIRYGECEVLASAHLSEWEPDWVSKELTPSKETKEPECLERVPSPRGLAPQPTCVERGLPPRMAAPKLGLDETMELLSRVLGVGDEDPDLRGLSAALKAKLGLSE